MLPIVLTLGGVFIAFLMLVEWRSKLTRQLQQHVLGLRLLSKLKGLTALIQKHRGLNAALLRGENNALPPLGALRSQINEQITLLTNQPKMKRLERWQAFVDHWQRMQQHSLSMSVANSFEQHTNMIANLLLLFEDFADLQQFNYQKYVKLPNLSLLWRELPILIEYMGQARAIGVGVTVDGSCSQIEKLKLNTLLKNISQLSRVVFTHLRNNGNHSTKQHKLIQLASEGCAQFSHTIQRQLIDAKQISLDTESYFAQASQAMEASNLLLDYEMEELAKAFK
jgi:hypothetical protein